MFTGLIETVGRLEKLTSRGNYHVLTIAADFADEALKLGDSVSCDGACLTVIAVSPGRFVVEASQETAARTILNDYAVGRRINLERALQVGDRLGGHFVMGHVDDTAKVDYLKSVGESLELAVAFEATHDRLVIEKGSVALNGVSLTINACRSGWLSVNIIPHTAKETNLGTLQAGERVNIEFDMIGKYIVRARGLDQAGTVSMDLLKESGW